jgi:hypothetical protein
VPRAKNDVEDALLSKGFRQDDRHHRYFIYHMSDGQKSRMKTKTSHGKKPKSLSDDLVSQMANQCGLTKAEFLNLVDCPMSRTHYEHLIVVRNKA